ncbi:stage III sporulation protein AG [Thalassobacillus sp. CUG 92003]|uniref:stage III sporulation protein AG n=1 Tax=Thalassobacillus sp. CUG 92003 TaxID=2736641 RepID=UPI0015E7C7A7|nr:stage III sporulation protein AG [Thalassobacillus sp. CUG 92003]
MSKYLKNMLGNLSGGEGRKFNKKIYVIALGVIGIFLLLIGNWLPDDKEAPPEPPIASEANEDHVSNDESDNKEIKALESSYEEQLQPLLENIEGISDVDLMINLEATQEKVFDKNLIVGKQTTEELDDNGGERSIEDYSRENQIILVRQGDREVPLLVKTKKPGIKGVLIVAKGVENMELKSWVVEATSRVLDVPSHRVSVMPKP